MNGFTAVLNEKPGLISRVFLRLFFALGHLPARAMQR
jgi:hypothetical protein